MPATTPQKKTTPQRKTTPQKKKGWARQPKGSPENACTVEGCKRPYRAKGYCYFHFKKWRQGELPHGRYRTCSKAECRQKAVRHGLCEKHEAEARGTKGGETAASA